MILVQACRVHCFSVGLFEFRVTREVWSTGRRKETGKYRIWRWLTAMMVEGVTIGWWLSVSDWPHVVYFASWLLDAVVVCACFWRKIKFSCVWQICKDSNTLRIVRDGAFRSKADNRSYRAHTEQHVCWATSKCQPIYQTKHLLIVSKAFYRVYSLCDRSFRVMQ